MIGMIIYAAGVMGVVRYGNGVVRREEGKITSKDRVMILVVSLFSWIGLFGFIVAHTFKDVH